MSSHLVMRVNAQPRLDDTREDMDIHRQGWATMHARPNMAANGHVIWLDVLTALGHRTPLNGSVRQGAFAREYAYAWLAAGPVTDLAVVGAGELRPPLLLDLCHVAAAAGVRTWLIYTCEPADERAEALRVLAPATVDVDTLLTQRQSTPRTPQASTREMLEQVPDVHFLAFLDIADQVMTAEGAATVSALFASGRDQMTRTLTSMDEPGEADVSMALHTMTAHTKDPGEILALTRGAQAGALNAGWYLQVDLVRWLRRGNVTNLPVPLDDAEWAAVLDIHSPTACATVALATLGLAGNELLRVTRDEIRGDFTTVTQPGETHQLPPAGAQCLAAQAVINALFNEPGDPFLRPAKAMDRFGVRSIINSLRAIATQTGLAIRTGGTSWNPDKPWFNRAGICVRRLT